MQLRQLLGRQSRTKIRIALAHNGQHRLVKHRTQCAVARPATPARNQSIRPAGAERIEQPINLSATNSHQICRSRYRKASVGNID